jgi:Prokaryotic membrane lipoprotein lipid attachment site
MKRLFLAFSLLTLLSACQMNMPDLAFLDFFDGEEETAADGTVVDASVLLPDFTDARLEPIEEGLVLRVTGIAPVQGYYSAALVQIAGTAATLRFQVRAFAPVFVTQQAAARTQQLLVARILTFSELQGVRTIEVVSGNRQVTLRNR